MVTPERNVGSGFPESEYPLQKLTGAIIGAFLDVHRAFGFGFLEAVYKRALAVELGDRCIAIAQEVPYELFHRGISVGFYRADLVVGESVIVEAKTGLVIDPAGLAQVLNYLRAARLPVGLLLHFGPKPVIKRVVASQSVGMALR